MKKDGFLGVVQFIHPGSEHKINKTGWTNWNLRTHQRKFMAVEGESIDSHGNKCSSGLHFWGEWEGPSRSVYSWGSNPDALPSHLVVPEFPGSASPIDGLQNTDPYVFGDAFKYTLCKQVNKKGHYLFLTRLLPGTLVLFGSSVNSQFVLDTAMVVGDEIILHSSKDWEVALSHHTPAYRAMTLEPMYWDKSTRDDSIFTLYQGATNETPKNQIYSFSPCIVATDASNRFARPCIKLPGVVNQKLMMAQKGTQMSISEIQECWTNVVTQTFNQGLLLGVKFAEPQLNKVPDHVWPH